jgi:hypothetical protein
LSTDTSSTQYAIQFNITHTADGSQDVANFNLTLPAWTDAEVSAFVQGLEALPIPAGCAMQLWVNKNTQVSTAYTTDTATNPITFA